MQVRHIKDFGTKYKLHIAAKIVVFLLLVITVLSGKSERYMHPYPAYIKTLSYPVIYVRKNPLPVNTAMREVVRGRRIPGYSFVKIANEQQFKNIYHFGFNRLKYFFEGTVYGDWFGPVTYSIMLAKIDNKPELHECTQ